MMKDFSTNEKPVLQNIRNNRRILYTSLITFFILSLVLLAGGRSAIHNDNTTTTTTTTTRRHEGDTTWLRQTLSTFISKTDSSSLPISHDHVLILTPLKNAAAYLPTYFELVDQLEYPKSKLSLAFLVSDTTDDTVAILRAQQQQLKHRYHSFHIYEKDFHFDLPEGQRHQFELQPLRRSFMARSRNYLLSTALRPEHDYVLWLDVDVVKYSSNILNDLISVNEDVVVPNCLRLTEDGSFW
jgi:hypothetical protein